MARGQGITRLWLLQKRGGFYCGIVVFDIVVSRPDEGIVSLPYF